MKNENELINKYLLQAQEIFNQYGYFLGSANYWKQGCILNSIIDYLYYANKAGILNKGDSQTYLSQMAGEYGPNGNWYDDWGWWGNASAKVIDPKYHELFRKKPVNEGEVGKIDTDSILRYTKIAKNCFHYMKFGDPSKNPLIQGAPNSYNTVISMAKKNGGSWEELQKKARPYWNIGCWQFYLGVDNYNPITSGGAFGWVQNTVTNALYYSLSQRLMGTETSTQKDIDDMTTFFYNWMGNAKGGNNNVIIAPLSQIVEQYENNEVLFRERVSTYWDGNPVTDFIMNWKWTGDQGLMISALSLLYQKEKDSGTLELILSIIRGVFSQLIDNNLILPWKAGNYSNPGSSPGYDPNDYASGAGIFMRGLLQASEIPEVKTLIKKNQSITQNMADVCLNGEYPQTWTLNGGNIENSDCSLATGGQGTLVFKRFNEFSTLIAASQLLVETSE
ncbi:MAG: hypothetical protein ACI8ZM_004429 [Crocinitomix sp.]|jgi:hypothetical protein